MPAFLRFRGRRLPPAALRLNSFARGSTADQFLVKLAGDLFIGKMRWLSEREERTEVGHRIGCHRSFLPPIRGAGMPALLGWEESRHPGASPAAEKARKDPEGANGAPQQKGRQRSHEHCVRSGQSLLVNVFSSLVLYRARASGRSLLDRANWRPLHLQRTTGPQTQRICVSCRL